MIPEKAGPRFSIVLCTRNPKPEYLGRVLAAIDGQTVPTAEREVVVVDSASHPPLSDREITWPAGTRIEPLDQPGVARARIAGVEAVRGDWIVFVDDDNVLDSDYLEQASAIIARHPDIALFCGRISGEFEAPPPEWLGDFYRQLAIIDFPQDSWANKWDPAKIPCWTAGMCIRSDVAKAYCDHVRNDPFVVAIKTRTEDVYLVMHTVMNGHTAGLFHRLHLTHLISRDRMTVDYLCRIARETGFNMTVIRSRMQRLSWRDFLRPVKNSLLATMKYGWSPRGRITRAATGGDFWGAVDCFVKNFTRGRHHA